MILIGEPFKLAVRTLSPRALYVEDIVNARNNDCQRGGAAKTW